MDQNKTRPVKGVESRFKMAAQLMVKYLTRKVKETAESIGHISHKKGSLTSPRKQQREAQTRSNIRARSKMNKK